MKRAIFTAAVAMTALAAGIMPAHASTGSVVSVYDALPAAGTPNIASTAFESEWVSEFGDAITFDGTARTLNSVTVTMSSWACQTGAAATNDCGTTVGAHFTHPITLSIYDSPVTGGDGTVVPGQLIARVTKTFSLPYRPSVNYAHCNAGNGSLGKWYSRAKDHCYNGKAANISWNFTTLALHLPDTAVIGVAYNTTDFGYNPIGSAPCVGTSQGCPYDALNVGTNDTVSIGSKPYPDATFQNTSLSSELCDSSPALGEFNLDSPTNSCWAGLDPAIKVTAH
jgi:hypothetical protein